MCNLLVGYHVYHDPRWPFCVLYLGQMICSYYSSSSTSARQSRDFPILYDLDISEQIYSWSVWSVWSVWSDDLYDLAHVPGWEPHHLHDLARVSCVGSVLHKLDLCYTDPAEHLITAGWDIDHLDHLDRDLSEVCNFVFVRTCVSRWKRLLDSWHITNTTLDRKIGTVVYGHDIPRKYFLHFFVTSCDCLAPNDKQLLWLNSQGTGKKKNW